MTTDCIFLHKLIRDFNQSISNTFLFTGVLEMLLFPSILFYTAATFSLYGEYVVRSFLSGMVFFYLVTTGWIFDISFCENSEFN